MTRAGSNSLQRRLRPSFFIPSTGPDDRAIVEGFKWLVSEAADGARDGMIAVPQKGVLDNIAGWSSLAVVFRALRRHGATDAAGFRFELFTRRDRGTRYWDGPILAIYGGQELLDAVDAIMGVTAVLYIPWELCDHLDWAATWKAKELGDKSDDSATEQDEIDSGIASTALASLTSTINLSTGISHPCDYERAVQTLETLFHRGRSVTPETIRRELVRLGWEPEHARSVKTLAEKVWQGRRPKASKGRANDMLWRHWQETANETD